MGKPGDRESRPGQLPEFQSLSPAEIAAREARNGLLQFDRLRDLIDEAVAKGARFRLRLSMLSELNRIAVDGLLSAPGHLRQVPIGITGSSHVPPPPDAVMGLVEQMCDYVDENWEACSAIHLSSYVLWRFNWIHPFCDGNGRTARAASYLVLCARLGYRLPGASTIPERIAAEKRTYYRALDEADAAWKDGRVALATMESMLKEHLAGQLLEVVEAADEVALQSTFISYGGPDEAFARRLNDGLKKAGVKTFFFPEDAVPGDALHAAVRNGVNERDRVILVCSKASLDRKGVLNEIEETLRREARDGGVTYLLPIRLDRYVFSGWTPAEPSVAQTVRDRVVADFEGADADPVKFDRALSVLLSALRRDGRRDVSPTCRD